MTKAERWRNLAVRLFSERDLTAIDELFDPDYEGEYAGKPVHGREAFRASIAAMLAGIHDTRMDVHATSEDGDLLWSHWTCTGIHGGALMGLPATKRPVTIVGVTLNHFRGDRIVKGFVKWDRLALVEALQ